MRINSNKKIHKMKRDPYQLLIRATVTLVIFVGVSAVIFLLCNAGVQSDYQAKRQAVAKQNEEGLQEHNAKMNALRESNNALLDPDTGDVVTKELAFWETTLDDTVWRLEDEGYAALENVSTITVNRSEIMNGGVMLVNAWHPLPSDFTDQGLISVGNTSGWKIAVASGTVRLFPEPYAALQRIIEAATTAELTNYIVREAYRSNDDQTALFNARMEKLATDYSGDILIEQTKKKVNYPGTSEYQTGLSFQMGLYKKDDPAVANQLFQETPQGIWFTNNSWKYGVVFRFPTADFPVVGGEDKSYKTGVSSNLNLYRYVGEAHAAAMKIMDYCLEEYVEFLIDHPHICIYEDGALKYEIYRIKAEDAATYDVPVPNPATGYTASLDNMGGVVMAYTYGN